MQFLYFRLVQRCYTFFIAKVLSRIFQQIFSKNTYKISLVLLSFNNYTICKNCTYFINLNEFNKNNLHASWYFNKQINEFFWKQNIKQLIVFFLLIKNTLVLLNLCRNKILFYNLERKIVKIQCVYCTVQLLFVIFLFLF